MKIHVWTHLPIKTALMVNRRLPHVGPTSHSLPYLLPLPPSPFLIVGTPKSEAPKLSVGGLLVVITASIPSRKEVSSIEREFT